MPRQARSVFANIPHHITQRGNRRQDVFFCDADKDYYLKLLRQYTKIHQVKILAYCLMSNHVHLILLPKDKDGLQKVLKPLHMRYSQYINKQNNWQGILWQGRFFSSPLDEQYTYHAFAYVENNPVQAGMVEQATDYVYSSAQHHAGLCFNPLVDAYDIGVETIEYEKYLSAYVDIKKTEILRRNSHQGLPCGGVGFVEKLSKIAGRDLAFKGVGRPKKG